MSDSMLYTIGTALNRARDHHIPVELLVEGSWVSGVVVAVDGFGVVLSSDEREHMVVRVEAVSAVRVMTPAPGRVPIDAGAHPMPRPRPAYE
jgi:sRNA-binding regulator protein Hfq